MSSSTSVPVAVFYRDPNPKRNASQRVGRNWRNQPQMNSLIPGALIFMSGGMDLALGLGWSQKSNIVTTLHFQYCWFIGVCIGAIVAAPLICMLPKRIFKGFSALLVLIGGIIFTSAPTNYDAIIAARYLNGIAIGLATVSFLVHASEIAANSYRGTCLAVEQYALAFGILLQVIYASQWPADLDFEVNRLHGIFSIIFALIAFGGIATLVESPIFHIRRTNEPAALECQRLLRRPREVTDETLALLEQNKAYVIQNENLDTLVSFRLGLMPLFKVLTYRCMLAFCFSLPLNLALQGAAFVSLGEAINWVPIVFVVLRLLGALLGMFLLDGLGRKTVSLFSLVVLGGLVLGIGAIFSDSFNIFDDRQMSIVCTLSLLMQFFAGMFAPSTSVYLGEAFPLLVKSYFIAFCVVLENVIHVIVICTLVYNTYSLYVYCLSVGVVMVCLFLLYCIVMPETRNTTLKEAQDRFARLLNLKFF